ncbi:MAG: hypothetical protein PVH45_00115 [Candidatus Omnitrophota bacterium]|jgi:rubrerythrin
MNIDLLRKEFNEILVLEERARHFYDHYSGQVEDKEIKEALTGIRDDEILHVDIAKKLLEILKAA